MADPTLVDGQITDAVTQANSKSACEPIEGAARELLGELIRALGVASQKGLNAHQQAVIISRAASVVDINLLYPIDTEGQEITAAEVVSYLRDIIDTYERRQT